MPEPDTFAAHAEDGVYYLVMCQGCRHQRHVSARQIVAAGLGHLRVVGSHGRWRCPKCGHRGAGFTINGYWTANPIYRPADWAETVEQRMGGLSRKENDEDRQDGEVG